MYASHFATLFADSRLAKRGEKILSMACRQGPVCIHAQGQGRAFNEASYRWYRNDSVTYEQILAASYARTHAALSRIELTDSVDLHRGRQWYFCPSDTTKVGLNHLDGALKVNDPDIGRIDRHSTNIGFLVHSMLVLGPNKDLIGLSRAHLWNRPFDNPSKTERSYQELVTSEKESQRWTDDWDSSQQLLPYLPGTQAGICHLMDREADAYPLLCKTLGMTDRALIVRSAQDRLIEHGKHRKLHELLDDQPPQASYKLQIPSTAKRNKRTALLEIKFAKVWIKCPNIPERNSLPCSIPYFVVQAKEITPDLPAYEDKIEWNLLSSIPVESVSDAIWTINGYAARWPVEDYFAAVKSRGAKIEATQLRSGKAIKKQIAMSLEVAVYIRALLADRCGEADRQANELFTEQEQLYAQVIRPKLEKTGTKCVNPYAKDKLAHIAWIVARLGGWDGYISQGLPGSKTFSKGIEKFFWGFEVYSAIIEKNKNTT